MLFDGSANTFLEYPAMALAEVCSCTFRWAVRPRTSHDKFTSLASLWDGAFHPSSPKGQFSLQAKSSLTGGTSQRLSAPVALSADTVFFLKKISESGIKPPPKSQNKKQVQVNLNIQHMCEMEFNHGESTDNFLQMNGMGSTFWLIPKHFKVTIQHLLTWNVSSYQFWADFCRLTPSAYLAVMLWSPQLPRKWCRCHSGRCFQCNQFKVN